MKSVDKKIKKIQQEKSDKNDAVKASFEISNKIQQIVSAGYSASQKTQSVDERISILVNTLQNAANLAIDFHNKLENDIKSFDVKLDILLEIQKDIELELKETKNDQKVTVIEESEVEIIENDSDIKDEESKKK